ncbi:DUF1351 domain-containing protein [Papillibacter cinnamivorans]|uniref:DUF1351 domain-containing protein n=1 Tax=Papillibacter cinnamivorans DSM 12816 TaxID=1122930 RepID=A0A1W1YQ50_9FIRM|nr:DUF1351 domain-containing protein [Papillibacter cinnamivorans]SMC38273.1 Protein of unknown function [Papillibacter cinnamivorans DSM 12816]
MQLVIFRPTDDQFVKSIDFNHEEIKQELRVALEKYQGLVYSEDNIRDAKVDRASLNKFREAIEARRKEIKKQCLAPYEDFEKKIREITAMIDEPILAIDGQVKAFEERKREERRAEIEEFYRTGDLDDVRSIIPLEKIWNEKWLNTTTPDKKIKDDIRTVLDRAARDLEVLKTVESEFSDAVKIKYLDTLDLSAALRERARLAEQKEKLEAYRRIQEEAAAEAEAGRVPPPDFSKLQPGDKVSFAGADECAPVPEPLQTITFTVTATAAQFKMLREFFIKNNIKYGRA